MELQITNKTALVLEGGGMRGVFTCGVLDYFIANKIDFPFVIGVSAGSINGVSYISKQLGRAKKSNIDVLEEYQYMSLKNWLLTGNYVDDKFAYETITESILPFDFEAYKRNPTIFEMVTTNCETGQAEYFREKKDKARLLNIIRSSSRLPFLSPYCFMDGVPYLDGGISNSIPLERALQLGYTDSPVVVLTQKKGYRKKVQKMPLAKCFYRKYPQLIKALTTRYLMYNKQLDYVEELESQGAIKVLRPSGRYAVSRTEKSSRKMNLLYEEGYRLAADL